MSDQITITGSASPYSFTVTSGPDMGRSGTLTPNYGDHTVVIRFSDNGEIVNGTFNDDCSIIQFTGGYWCRGAACAALSSATSGTLPPNSGVSSGSSGTSGGSSGPLTFTPDPITPPTPTVTTDCYSDCGTGLRKYPHTIDMFIDVQFSPSVRPVEYANYQNNEQTIVYDGAHGYLIGTNASSGFSIEKLCTTPFSWIISFANSALPTITIPEDTNNLNPDGRVQLQAACTVNGVAGSYQATLVPYEYCTLAGVSSSGTESGGSGGDTGGSGGTSSGGSGGGGTSSGGSGGGGGGGGGGSGGGGSGSGSGGGGSGGTSSGGSGGGGTSSGGSGGGGATYTCDTCGGCCVSSVAGFQAHLNGNGAAGAAYLETLVNGGFTAVPGSPGLFVGVPTSLPPDVVTNDDGTTNTTYHRRIAYGFCDKYFEGGSHGAAPIIIYDQGNDGDPADETQWYDEGVNCEFWFNNDSTANCDGGSEDCVYYIGGNIFGPTGHITWGLTNNNCCLLPATGCIKSPTTQPDGVCDDLHDGLDSSSS